MPDITTTSSLLGWANLLPVRRPRRRKLVPLGKSIVGCRWWLMTNTGVWNGGSSSPGGDPVVGPVTSLGTELAAVHDLCADALAPHAGQSAVPAHDKGHPPYRRHGLPGHPEPRRPLGAAGQGVERHVLASGVAVEGYVRCCGPGSRFTQHEARRAPPSHRCRLAGRPRGLVADRSQGVQLAAVQALARYWTSEYDWRQCEETS